MYIFFPKIAINCNIKITVKIFNIMRRHCNSKFNKLICNYAYRYKASVILYVCFKYIQRYFFNACSTSKEISGCNYK